MKTFNLKVIGFFVIAATVFTFSSCDEQFVSEYVEEALSLVQTDSIDADCCNSLVYMREEEKLAHDVYVNMFDLWEAKVFENISKSETVHTNAIKGLLGYYGIDDPVLSGVGEFANAELQTLYNTLITTGTNSLIDALKVGATIEEVDIIDIDEAMEGCDVDTIQIVYDRLRTGSTHHLKAFVANLAKKGIDYKPQYLSQSDFDEIINGKDSVTGGGDCKDSIDVASLTDEEAAGLLFMREEEKLAHDVYVNMFNLWGVKIFENISKSETQHTEKVLSLLNLYGLEDPVLPGIGEFSNEDLQALYNQLMEQGSDSLVAALIVGATIEEVDILDLYERMEQTENATILKVYSSLEKGSEAHLRAFDIQLKRNDYDYEPQFLTKEQFDTILQ